MSAFKVFKNKVVVSLISESLSNGMLILGQTGLGSPCIDLRLFCEVLVDFDLEIWSLIRWSCQKTPI